MTFCSAPGVRGTPRITHEKALPETIYQGGFIMGMHVVLVGNPVDGFEVYGPFKTYDHAAAWTDDPTRSHWTGLVISWLVTGVT